MSPLPPSPFMNPVMPTTGPAVAFSEPSGSAATAALFPEPPPNEGRSDGAPALDAPPNAHEDAGATDLIHEIFHFARKLMTHQPRFVLDEKRFLAEIEHPLFVIEDGSLHRREA